MSTAVSRHPSDLPRRLVLMGVAGCGKSVVGALLAARLGMVYIDGDDLHPSGNIAKMSAGVSLDDDDRWPWLSRVAQVLGGTETPTIVGCSALRRRYRVHIVGQAGAPVGFIHLMGTPDVIARRLATRQGHFMPATLLQSQFAALERPGSDENAIEVDIDQPVAAVVDAVLAKLKELRQ